MKLNRTATAAVAALVAASLLAACTQNDPEPTTGTTTGASGFPESWSNEITIDVFDGLANFQGIQTGWFGEIVKQKFNMKLNIIAPNVAGGGDTLFNTRVAAGDLGDLIITDKGEKLDELIEGGLIYDSSEFYPNMTNTNVFDRATQNLNAEKDGIWAFPTSVSSLKPTDPSEGLAPTFGVYLRWDLYKNQGYPALGTLEDLLPVLKKMQDEERSTTGADDVYAMSLFKDWDGNMMNNVKQPITYYGYDEMGFALAKADGSDYQGILQDGGMYLRVLKFYNDAYRQGLVDPESTTQNWDSLYAKVQNGKVLYTWWPWLGQSAFNTADRTGAGQGFMLAPLADQTIFSYGAEVNGGKQVLAIGSKAEDPERIAAFIDWLYSAEGTYANSSQTSAAAGPQGLTWDMNASGEPELNQLGTDVFINGAGTVPAEFGGGDYFDGVSALNVNVVLPQDVDQATGFPYNYTFWPTYQTATSTPLSDDWSANMGGATSAMDYLKTNNQLLVAPGASFTTPADDSETETLRNQVKAVIVQYSWQAAFADSESQFNSLVADMQEQAKGLGYDQVLEVDMANAKLQDDARKAIAAEFQ
ncbi:ABC transporter substrate-binding protein [Demequina sp.]|uniref:ABC transporter substrate-binding protein n=1 Tax=Demequina sp. TaxID=2050685 RepID=UPI003D0CE0AF